jgi:Ca2+-transporting ATPase
LPPNPYLTWAVGGSLALQGLTLFIPGLRNILNLTPVGLLDGLVIGGAALLPLAVNEATKSMTRTTAEDDPDFPAEPDADPAS